LFVIIGVLINLCVVPIVLVPLLFYYGLALYFFLVPVMVLERTGPGLGTNRAQYLGRVRFWPTLGFVFVIWLVWVSSTRRLVQLACWWGATVEGAIAVETVLSPRSPFSSPIMPIGLTLMYYDARIRVEGLDFALQSVDSPEPRPSDVESPHPAERLITGRDLANTFLLTAGLVALGCGLWALLYLIFTTVA
jgi:hypothetical protein